MTKTPTEEAWESLATLVETKGAHWRLTDSPADDCVDVPVADLRLALADRARLQAERDRAVEERARLARFADVALRALWDGHDFDAEDIQDAALKHGLIRATVFNPNIHIDHLGVGAEAGDEWFVPSEWVEALFTHPPPDKEAEPEPVALDTYDAGLLGDGGGGDVGWWHDYIRAELERAHEFYASQITTPPALQARVEALEGALREAQSVLAMLVEPGAIQQTTVINAYAAAKTAEAKARAALTGEKEGEADGR